VLAVNEKISEQLEHRGKLLARIAAQREQMTKIGSDLRAPLAMADRGVAVAQFLRSHPLLFAGVVVFFVIRRPSMASLVWLGGRVWKIYRDFTLLLAKRLSRD
jgi:hypothetical protein